MPDPDPLIAARNDPRVLYAAERTFLAWTRTGLALMGFGFVVARFGLFLRELLASKAGTSATQPAHSPRLSLVVGILLVTLGVATHLAASLRHHAILRRLQPPAAPDRRWSSLVVAMGFILAAIGMLLAGYLVYTR